MQFIIDSIQDLKKQLKDLGGDLIVRIGKPEEIIQKLVRQFNVNQVFCHTEIIYEDLLQENRVKNVVEEEGAKFKTCWGSTLHHIEDLPIKLAQIPKSFGEFCKKIQKASKKIRKTTEKPNKINFAGLGNTEPEKIPTFSDLGIQQKHNNTQNDIQGGESQGIRKVDDFIQLMLKQRNSHHGAVFANKVSPWLSLGCVSPRDIFDRMNRACAKDDKVMQVLKCELVWRDYFRFSTRKLSETKTGKEKSSRSNVDQNRSSQPCAVLA